MVNYVRFTLDNYIASKMKCFKYSLLTMASVTFSQGFCLYIRSYLSYAV